MDLTNVTILKSLLAKHGAKPRQGWGQNFLVSKKFLDAIIAVADIKKTDYILEVGGGAGTLTQELATRAKEVTVIEKDQQLLPVLTDVLHGFANVHIIKADALKLKELPYTEAAQHWRIIANIPYWITGRFLRHVLESKNPPTEILLMVQKEVAERICMQPSNMNLLAVSVRYYATPEIVIDDITPNNFWPASGVNSAILKINVRKNNESKFETEKFFAVVRAGFAHPRKQLRVNLKHAFGLTDETINTLFMSCNIKNTARAQELSVHNWQCFSNRIMV